MKDCFRFASIVGAVIAGASAASGATLIWTNTAGGNWNVAAHWSPNQVPVAADDVFVTNSGTYVVTLPSTFVALANSLTLGGESGTQTFTINSRMSISNLITVGSNGFFNIVSASGIQLTNSAGVEVHGRFRVQAGTSLEGSGPFHVNGGGQLEIGRDLTLTGRALYNEGTVIVSNAARVLLGHNAAFTNLAGANNGTVIMTNNNSAIQRVSNATNTFFANLGTLRTDNNVFIRIPALLDGSVNIESGELTLGDFSLEPVVQIPGSINVATGASLVCLHGTHNFLNGSLLAGAGTFRCGPASPINVTFNGAYQLTGLLTNSGATIQFNTGTPITWPRAGLGIGTIVGNDPITVSGTLEAGNSAIITGPAPFTIAAGATAAVAVARFSSASVLNEGVVRVLGQQLTLGNTFFTNRGLFRMTTNLNATGPTLGVLSGTTPLFVNEGELQSDAVGTATINPQVRQNGSLSVLVGTLTFESSGIHTGVANVSAGAVLRFSGLNSPTTEIRPGSLVQGDGSMMVRQLMDFRGTYAATGLLDVDSGTLNLNTGSPFSVPHLRNNASVVAGEDPLTITSTLFWRGTFGGPAPLFLPSTAETVLHPGSKLLRPFLLNAGAMIWTNVSFDLGNNVVVTNLPTGQITIVGNSGLRVRREPNTTNQVIYNEGLMRMTATAAAELALPLFNSGTVRLESSEFRMTFDADWIQTAGVTELAGGNIRFFGGNWQLYGGAVTGSGTVFDEDVENFGATISPGSSPGQINFRSLNQSPDGAMNIELAGTTPGTGFDKVAASDILILTGGRLNVTLANGFVPAVGEKFLFATGNRVGTFSSFTYPSNQVTLQLNYLPNGVEVEVLDIPLQISPPNVTLLSGMTQTFTASSGTPPYTFTISTNNSGGTINAATGFYTAGPTNDVMDIVTVTDASTRVARAAIQVNPPLRISPTNAVVGSGQTQTFAAIGGLPPYTFTLAQNNSGASINSSSGVYAAGGIGEVTDTIQITDSATGIAQTTVTIVPFNLIISATTAQEFLNLVTTLQGSLIMSNVDTRTSLLMPNLASVGSNVVIRENDLLERFDLSMLQFVGGSIDISLNPALTNIAFPVTEEVGGDLTVVENESAESVIIITEELGGDLTVRENESAETIIIINEELGGDLTVVNNDAAQEVDLTTLTSVGGDVNISSNTSLAAIHLAQLTSAKSVQVSGNSSATDIDLRSLRNVGETNGATPDAVLKSLVPSGSLTILRNASTLTINLGSLLSIHGDVDLSDNPSVKTIILTNLTHIGGGIDISLNPALTNIAFPMLTNIAGTVNFSTNALVNGIDLGAVERINGNVTIIEAGMGDIDLGAAQTIDGDVTIIATGSGSIGLGAVETINGDVAIIGSDADAIDLGAAATFGGDVTIVDSEADVIDLGAATTFNGDVIIIDSQADVIDLGAAEVIDGNVVMEMTSATTVNLGSLTSVGGNVLINSNSALIAVNLSQLISAKSVKISDNNSAAVIDLRALRIAAESSPEAALKALSPKAAFDPGAIHITGNAAVTNVDLRSLTNVVELNISGNPLLSAIDLSSLPNLDGSLRLIGNAANHLANLSSLGSVGDGVSPTVIELSGGTYTFANGLNIARNATLTGFGTIIANVRNAGTIIPGSSPGQFLINGHLDLVNSSELRLEVGGYLAGTESDFLSVAGSVTLGGTLSVNLVNQFERVMTNGASFTVLAAGSPVTGAFANVASGGSLTTPDGYVRFTVHYAGETAVRLTGVLVDADNDGMPDWWEDLFGFSKTNPIDAALDLDDDAASNVNEFLAGTLPNDAASLFRIVSLERDGENVRITWTTVGGKSYRVQATLDLDEPFFDLGAPIVMPGTGESTTNFLDFSPLINGTNRYYRIQSAP